MPPKVMKGKAKAKGKGKAKGKAKAKAKAVVEATSPVIPVIAEEEQMAIKVAKPKAKSSNSSNFVKELMASLGDTSIEDAMSDRKNKLLQLKARLEEGHSQVDAEGERLEAAQKEVDDTRSSVDAGIALERAATKKYYDLEKELAELRKSVQEEKKMVEEIQKKYALTESHISSEARIKELEAKRKAASEAAERAKREVKEQKELERKALEDTRKAMAQAREAKGAGRGAKRPASESVGTQSPTKKAVVAEPMTPPMVQKDAIEVGLPVATPDVD